MVSTIVRMSFRGPVHFGQGRLSDGGYTCDAGTLFSALYIEALREGSQDELLEAVRCGELAISDAFPYMGETLYLPKPMVGSEVFDRRNQEQEALGRRDSRERKANKKLSFVPAERYRDYLKGEFDPVTELARFNFGKSSLQTKVNLTREDGDDARPYFVGGFTYSPGSGIYFIVQGNYDLAGLMEQLSYAGIGGKRTSGYGRFEFRIEDSSSQSVADPDSKRVGDYVLLSTAAPRSDELDDMLLEGARYKLVRRGGFIQSTTHSPTPQKKRDMYLFAAGSTFTRRFEGDVFDVNETTDGHPVYRYAKALWMGV